MGGLNLSVDLMMMMNTIMKNYDNAMRKITLWFCGYLIYE